MSEWYYADGDQQFGGVPEETLADLIASGEVLSEDLVWCEGMEDWVAAGDFRIAAPCAR